MPKESTLIAVVDDEQSVRKALERLLRSAGFAAATFGSGSEFLEAVCARRPDCVVLDLHMPQMDGFEVQAALAERDIRVPVIVVTGHDTWQNRERALELGAQAYLHKPVDDSVLLNAIQSAVFGDG